MNKYELAKIYKIVNDVNDDVYIGSTCNTLWSRWGAHKQCIKNPIFHKRKIYESMLGIGIEHFRIVLVLEYPCNSRDQLTAKEEEYIQELKPVLNCISAIKNVVKVAAKDKKYYENHLEQLQEKRKTLIECVECNKQVSAHNMARHKLSASHILKAI